MMIMLIIAVWGFGPVGLGWVGSIKWTHGQLCARSIKFKKIVKELDLLLLLKRQQLVANLLQDKVVLIWTMHYLTESF